MKENQFNTNVVEEGNFYSFEINDKSREVELKKLNQEYQEYKFADGKIFF